MVEMCDIAKETFEIINYCDLEIKSKIPESIINYLKEISKESKKIVNIDINKKFKEQDISEECKNMFSILYYKYIASDTEKIEILKIWNENDLNYQKNLSQKYNIEEILNKRKHTDFKNKETINSNIQELKIIKKDNIFKRILIKIMNYFKNK